MVLWRQIAWPAATRATHTALQCPMFSSTLSWSWLSWGSRSRSESRETSVGAWYVAQQHAQVCMGVLDLLWPAMVFCGGLPLSHGCLLTSMSTVCAGVVCLVIYAVVRA